MRISGKLQGVALAAAVLSIMFGASPRAQTSIQEQELVARVQKALQRLPYYGVFDFLAFRVERGTATLQGYAYRAALEREAIEAVRRVPGVDDVVNRIEVLPSLQLDETLRLATFTALYGDDHFSPYIAGGATTVRYDFNLFARFLNMQPVGMYPIHIIVKRQRTTLIGTVNTELDRVYAATRARSVPGALTVDVDIAVAR